MAGMPALAAGALYLANLAHQAYNIVILQYFDLTNRRQPQIRICAQVLLAQIW
ncbi:hypothetical protein FHW94_002753 [Novosphingobium sp. SG720]|nr:hypothetical protein [Novosphingobium sp. SG720]